MTQMRWMIDAGNYFNLRFTSFGLQEREGIYERFKSFSICFWTYIFFGPVGSACRNILNLLNNIHSFNHLTENGILAVKMRGATLIQVGIADFFGVI